MALPQVTPEILAEWQWFRENSEISISGQQPHRYETWQQGRA